MRHALVTAPPPAQARYHFFAGTLGGLGREHLGHYLVTHEAAKCSRDVFVCLLTGVLTSLRARKLPAVLAPSVPPCPVFRRAVAEILAQQLLCWAPHTQTGPRGHPT